MTLDDVEFETLFHFPKNISQISTAAWLKNGNVLITGHKNGFLAIWDIFHKSLVERYNLGSEIECISVSVENKILIGCNSGDIFLLDPRKSYAKSCIREGANDRFSRIWQLKWIDELSFVASSTYGNVMLFERLDDDKWISKQLVAHSNSVFAVDFQYEHLATADYRGLIVIWKRNDGTFEQVGSVRALDSIEALKWRSESSFSAVSQTGHVYYIEFDPHEDNWFIAFDAFVALNKGQSVEFDDSGNALLAITKGELLHIEPTTQQIKKHNLKGGVTIDSFGTNILRVVCQDSVLQMTVNDIVVPDSLVKYKFAKISLIGHTGVGKSTLCDAIIGKEEYDKQSTYGKKVWEWKLKNGEDRRVMFHDHGGQEPVMYTFLPFISDSDILLLLFMKKDSATFNKIETLTPRIRKFVNEETSVILVETWIDQDVDDVPKERINRLISSSSALDCLYVSATTGMGLEDLKKKLINEIAWDSARVVVQSVESENTMSLIREIQDSETFTLQFHEVHAMYNNRWSHISKIHLKFLLTNFSSEGLIEFYPDASDFIIFGGKNYRELRSKIPIFATGQNGIVSIGEIEDKFSNLPEYVKIVDSLFKKYGIHIKNGDLRIFPELLRAGDVSFDNLSVDLDEKKSKVIEVKTLEINHELLIQALSDLNLQCVDLTTSQGLFKWENNTFLYYVFQKSGDAVRGASTKFTFYLAGDKEKYTWRLQQNFTSIIDGLFGPIIKSEHTEDAEDLKKNDEKDYDIAISYASEQSEYVTAVVELLRNNGIRVFFAPFAENDMWGRNIDEFLQETYFSKAKTCLMFISKDYVGKDWCRLECKSAFARQKKQGLYILPVRFDNTELIGLDPDLYHLEASSNPPDVLSRKVIDKLEHEGLI